jgi:hypothetical protein
MDKRILALTFCTTLLIPKNSLGQRARTLSLVPETKTTLLEAPKRKPTHTTRNLFVANAIMFGASIIEANAGAYGSNQCRIEDRNLPIEFGHPNINHGHGGGQLHPYQHDFKITIPLDLGVTTLSILLHKKHHDTLAVLFPVSSASAQIGSAGLKYGAGCF